MKETLARPSQDYVRRGHPAEGDLHRIVSIGKQMMVVLEAQEKKNGNGDELLKVAFLVGWSAGDELSLYRIPQMICLGLGASSASLSIAYNDGRQGHIYQHPPVASGTG